MVASTRFNAQSASKQISVLSDSITAYYAANCKITFVQPTLNSLITGGYLNATNIDILQNYISSVSVLNPATNPFVVISINGAIPNAYAIMNATPYAFVNGGAIEIDIPISSVSHVAYGYDVLFNKECGR